MQRVLCSVSHEHHGNLYERSLCDYMVVIMGLPKNTCNISPNAAFILLPLIHCRNVADSVLLAREERVTKSKGYVTLTQVSNGRTVANQVVHKKDFHNRCSDRTCGMALCLASTSEDCLL